MIELLTEILLTTPDCPLWHGAQLSALFQKTPPVDPTFPEFEVSPRKLVIRS